MMKITEQVVYVGVNDRTKHLFENLWPLPYGVSYNSYLIVDEKVALIDTVDAAFMPEYIEKIRSVLGERQPCCARISLKQNSWATKRRQR